MYAVNNKGHGQVVCVQPTDQGTASTITKNIEWPASKVEIDDKCKRVLSCSSDGSLLVAVDTEEFGVTTRAYDFLSHVSPAGEAEWVVWHSRYNIMRDLEETEAPTYDVWENMPDCMDIEQFDIDAGCWCVAADGHLIGYTRTGVVVRVELSKPVPPAHMQPEQPQGLSELDGTTSWASCEAQQLGHNWGAVLASGEGADVVLWCGGGETLRAHSLVLAAQWEYYRVLQRALAAGMRGGAAAGGGEVDVSEHSAATMQLVLQHLYTGRVQLTNAAPGDAGAGQQHVGSSQMQQTGAGAIEQQQGAGGGDAQAQQANLQQLAQLARAADALLLPSLHESCLALLGRGVRQLLTPCTALDLLLAVHTAGAEPLEQQLKAYVAKHHVHTGE
jgi:hypothetical protein